MSATATDNITMTLEEYEALLASKAKPTVVVDAAEYAELVQYKMANPKGGEQLARALSRVAELEGMLRREQAEHIDEYNQLLAEVKKRKGQA
jgi:hypothetical protein